MSNLLVVPCCERESQPVIKAWAAEDLRSLNGQIEYRLRGALHDARRLPSRARRHQADAVAEPDGPGPLATRGPQPSRSPVVREPAESAKLPR